MQQGIADLAAVSRCADSGKVAGVQFDSDERQGSGGRGGLLLLDFFFDLVGRGRLLLVFIVLETFGQPRRAWKEELQDRLAEAVAEEVKKRRSQPSTTQPVEVSSPSPGRMLVRSVTISHDPFHLLQLLAIQLQILHLVSVEHHASDAKVLHLGQYGWM